MMFKKRARAIGPALLGAAAVTGALIPGSFASVHTVRAAAPVYMVTNDAFHPTGFTRNFNPYNPNAMDYTNGAIYEPLMIITPAGGGHTYPWLATSATFSPNGKTLTVTLRNGLKWSDGQPLTAADVAFTFNYGKAHPFADQNGLWAGKYLQSVTASGANKVTFALTNADSTLLPNLVSNNIKIVPQHIWASVKDPASFTNPNPVGSGPFANVTAFSSQQFIYAKNQYYWQKLNYDGLKIPNFLDNNGANTAMEAGQLDWTGNFVPDIQKVYVAKDPAHFHYYFANTNPLGLWFNDQKYPYSMPGFRKALSYAIDRPRISNFAENGYELPSDATGIRLPFPTWYDKSLDAQSTEMTTYNPAKAKSMLLAMGFKLNGGQFYDPHGAKVSFTIEVPTPWSDWVLAIKLLAKDFQQIGINATIKTIDQATWLTQSQSGQLDAHLHWTGFSTTPYYTFYSYMSQQSFTPIGTDASLNGENNWERYTSAAATNLFAQFRTTQDVQKQKAIMDQVQSIQLQDFPYIPIMHSADWYTYSTLHFTGWPTESNFYVRGSANDYPDRTMVIASIRPAK